MRVDQGGITMEMELSTGRLAAMAVQVAVLSVGRYALPVRFRVIGSFVECRVPIWSGVGDMLADGPGEALLVAPAPASETDAALRWLFLRGPAMMLDAPDWEGLGPPSGTGVSPEDLYQVVRITPARLEWIDEHRGWGYRETLDL
jgi:hypothetical protein